MNYARRVNGTYFLTPDGKASYQIQERPFKKFVKKFDKKSLRREMEKVIEEIEMKSKDKENL